MDHSRPRPAVDGASVVRRLGVECVPEFLRHLVSGHGRCAGHINSPFSHVFLWSQMILIDFVHHMRPDLSRQSPCLTKGEFGVQWPRTPTPISKGGREMKFGLLYEMQRPYEGTDIDWNTLYKETLEQCELADQVGFDNLWFVEHHFLTGFSGSPCPEVMFGALSQRTKNIRIGFG
ncbi:MAG TPA: hypothetical protein DC056_07080, partial [Dehalococcoidia bacterium]|nr:hypothetical protein [Dehalococcoidia bacterium]